jgi:hypothetical protein
MLGVAESADHYRAAASFIGLGSPATKGEFLGPRPEYLTE